MAKIATKTEALTSEKAIQFLQAQNEKKVQAGLKIFQKALQDMDSIGCGMTIENRLQGNTIVSELKVVIKSN